MTLVIVLDSSPLGLASNPRATPENARCRLWLRSHLENEARVVVPSIIDYDFRRELLCAD
jgi:hypothetical protein